MPKKFNIEGIKRSDMYSVDPAQLVVVPEDRGRYIAPTEEDVHKLAVSIYKNGQRQPVQCRRVENDGLRLILGFTRFDAITAIRKGFEYQGVKYHDPEFLLKITVDGGVNAEMAFVYNVVENAHRNATSPIDDAHNQQRLRDAYSYDDEAIASLYECSVAQVQRLQKLLRLSAGHQKMVHFGELSVLGALDLLGVPEEKRDEVVEQVKAEGKVSGATVRAKVREATAANPSGKKLARSVKEIKGFFEKRSAGDDPAAEFARNIISFAKGEMTEEAFAERFDAFVGLAFPDSVKELVEA